jgi:Immunity protein 26
MTNLRILKRSRPRLRPGDIIVMSPSDGRFLFGRVILADLPSGQAPMPTANLIYIYAVESGAPTPAPLLSLAPTDLMLPPQFINRMPWTEGCFQNVAYEPLQQGDLLQQHCFWDSVRKVYRDETGGSSRHAPSRAASGDSAATACSMTL